MKLPILLLALIPIALFLKFVLLDILDSLVATQKKQRKAVTVNTKNYEYSKAQ